jgi:hypothetical protein
VNLMGAGESALSSKSSGNDIAIARVIAEELHSYWGGYPIAPAIAASYL